MPAAGLGTSLTLLNFPIQLHRILTPIRIQYTRDGPTT